MAFGQASERVLKVKEWGIHVGIGVGKSGTNGEGGIRIRAGGYHDDGEK